MKFVGALKKYVESEPNPVKVPLQELSAFAKSFQGEERQLAIQELRSYGFEIEDDTPPAK